MKKLSAFMIVGIVAVLSLSYMQAKAQNPMYNQATADTAALLATPIFTGAEQNKSDSVLSIGKAALDPETKAVLVDAANQLKDTPKGGGIGEWTAYLIGALGIVYGLYRWGKRRWTGKDPGESNKPITRPAS